MDRAEGAGDLLGGAGQAGRQDQGQCQGKAQTEERQGTVLNLHNPYFVDISYLYYKGLSTEARLFYSGRDANVLPGFTLRGD
jgi:hypothetical protein